MRRGHTENPAVRGGLALVRAGLEANAALIFVVPVADAFRVHAWKREETGVLHNTAVESV